MNKLRQVTILLALFAGLALVGAVLASPMATTVERFVLVGGGGHTEADNLTVDGAIGQPLVGTDTTAPFDLCSGFWCGLDGEIIPPSHLLYLPIGIHQTP